MKKLSLELKSTIMFIVFLIVITQPVFSKESRIDLHKSKINDVVVGYISVQGGVTNIPLLGFGLLVEKKPVKSWLLSSSLALEIDAVTRVDKVIIVTSKNCSKDIISLNGKELEIESQRRTGNVIDLVLPFELDLTCKVNLVLHLSYGSSDKQSVTTFELRPWYKRYFFSKTMSPFFSR